MEQEGGGEGGRRAEMNKQLLPMLAQQTQSAVAAMANDSALTLSSFSSAAPFYQGGGGVGGVGYMSSFAFNQSMNPNPSAHNFDHPSLNVAGVGAGVGPSSNLSLLQGFNVAAAAAALGNSSQGQNRPSLQQYYQMGGNGGTMFTSQQQGLNLIPSSTMSNASAAAWPQSFMNNGTISTTSIPTVNSDRNGNGAGGSGNGGVGAGADGSAGLTPNQWPDLSGFNPPQ
ncbi:hypothetical protein TSUD_386220 [Trifolium subterraneum]|uniref:Dof-type domain-containing protein n=1 Tax=Trifolium subterraneum TaxID=3900 RepID=A0A2Z6M0U4_TRISU|nr:hypothetical protein TSUD_386220 [Trifolium subterraneum]